MWGLRDFATSRSVYGISVNWNGVIDRRTLRAVLTVDRDGGGARLHCADYHGSSRLVSSMLEYHFETSSRLHQPPSLPRVVTFLHHHGQRTFGIRFFHTLGDDYWMRARPSSNHGAWRTHIRRHRDRRHQAPLSFTLAAHHGYSPGGRASLVSVRSDGNPDPVTQCSDYGHLL